MKNRLVLRLTTDTHKAMIEDMITFYHDMNPKVDYGVKNGTVHSILSTLDTLNTLLEMLNEQVQEKQ